MLRPTVPLCLPVLIFIRPIPLGIMQMNCVNDTESYAGFGPALRPANNIPLEDIGMASRYMFFHAHLSTTREIPAHSASTDI